MGCEALAEEKGIWVVGNQQGQQFIPTFRVLIDKEDTLATQSKEKSTTVQGEIK